MNKYAIGWRHNPQPARKVHSMAVPEAPNHLLHGRPYNDSASHFDGGEAFRARQLLRVAKAKRARACPECGVFDGGHYYTCSRQRAGDTTVSPDGDVEGEWDGWKP